MQKKKFKLSKIECVDRFVHHCCDALTVGAREFYPEFAKQTDLVQKMANFLGETDSINPLMVSYYSKVVINFLSQEPENVGEIIEFIKMNKFYFSF